MGQNAYIIKEAAWRFYMGGPRNRLKLKNTIYKHVKFSDSNGHKDQKMENA